MVRCSLLLALSSVAALLVPAEAGAEVRRRENPQREKAACASRCATQVHTIRLHADQDLITEIEKFAVEKNLEAAYVATCVGSLKNLTLHYATSLVTGIQKSETLNEYLEICALSGTVGSAAGAHLHVVAGRADGSAVAGHVMGNATVQFTAELVVASSPCERYDRAYDPEVDSIQLVVTPK